MTIILRGQLPSGKNQVLINPRSGRHYPNARFVAWRDVALREVMLQRQRDWRPACVPCEVRVIYTPGDRRRRDVAGIMDAICHLMERGGIVADDSLFNKWVWFTTEVDKDRPGAIIEVIKSI